jgi:peptidyl-prolyl cis-trans isomerase A (cyclophilin A)
MKRLSLCLLLIASGWLHPALAAETSPAPAAAATAHAATHSGPTQVQVVTSLGNFTIELNEERAPLTVASFLKYRVVASFVIQGGGFDANYKQMPAARTTPNESGNGLTNIRGTVGLARTSAPHSGDCQFYVNLADNNSLDPNPARWGYAVFGKIVQGMDVIDRIGGQPTGARGQFKEDAPLDPVRIERIERVTKP